MLAAHHFDFTINQTVQGVPWAGAFGSANSGTPIGIQAGGPNNSSASQCVLVESTPGATYPVLSPGNRTALIQIGSQFGVWTGNNTYRTLCADSPNDEVNGAEFWEGIAVRFPSKIFGTNSTNTIGGALFWEIHGPDNTLAPWNIQARSNQIQMRIAVGNSVDGFTFQSPWPENNVLYNTIPYDVPIKFAFHLIMGQTNGVAELYGSLNNAPLSLLLQRTGIPTFVWDNAVPASSVNNYREIGIYTGTSTLNGFSDPGQIFTAGSYRGTSFSDVQSWVGLAAGGSIPVNTALPTITVGQLTVGNSVSATSGGWTNSPTSIAYQYERCDSSGNNPAQIPGATSQVYTLAQADVQKTLRVLAVASNTAGPSLPAESAATSSVSGATAAAPQPPHNYFGYQSPGTLFDSGAGYIVLSGPYNTDATITSTNLYAYLRGGSSAGKLRLVVYGGVGGTPQNFKAVSNEVTVPAGQAAGWQTFSLPAATSFTAGSWWIGRWQADSNVVVYRDDNTAYDGYFEAHTYSSSTNPPNLTAPGLNSGRRYDVYALGQFPVIAGTAQVGQTLTVTSNGDWINTQGGINYAYSWYRLPPNGTATAISGAVSSTYTLQTADVGLNVYAVVVASNSAGADSGMASNQIGPIASQAGAVPAVSSNPTVTGTAQVTQSVTGTSGTWSNGVTSYTVQWQRSTVSSFTGNPVDIVGETSLVHTIGSSEIAAYERIKVIASNATGDSQPAYSTPIGPVAGVSAATAGTAAAPTLITPPTMGVNVMPRVGHTIIVTSGTYANTPTSISYQWQEETAVDSGVYQDIAGANQNYYVVQYPADRKRKIQVIETAANAFGSISTTLGPTNQVGVVTLTLTPL